MSSIYSSSSPPSSSEKAADLKAVTVAAVSQELNKIMTENYTPDDEAEAYAAGAFMQLDENL